jgi:hypothetical protein
MKTLLATVREVWRFFVGDLSHALAILAWVMVVALLARGARHDAWLGPVLFFGLAVILIENVRRAALLSGQQ